MVEFRKVYKKEIYHVSIMLECNLQLFDSVLLFETPAKELINLRMLQDFVE